MHMYMEVRKETLKKKTKKETEEAVDRVIGSIVVEFVSKDEKKKTPIELMKEMKWKNYSIIGSKMSDISIGDFRIFNFEIMK